MMAQWRQSQIKVRSGGVQVMCKTDGSQEKVGSGGDWRKVGSGYVISSLGKVTIRSVEVLVNIII